MLAIVLLLTSSVSLYAATDSDTKMDAVLAVDMSTSMNKSDKNKLSNEAMKMFIDMTSVSGDKIGILGYTDQVIREKALLKINNAKDKENLKTFVDQLTRGPYTDVAVGVSEALNILESGREQDHDPLIILLTDGNNSLNKDRTQQDSDKMLEDSLKKAKDAGVPIYTIGLNADGTLNKDVLQRISDETNGKMFVTTDAGSLPQILSEIFANHMKLKVVPISTFTSNGQYQDVTLSIPNASVLEANISIMSNKPVEVKLFDPSGQEQKIPSDSLLLSKSTAYSLLKILKPAQGDWKLQVKGANKEEIKINLLFNYDLEVVLAPLSKQNYKKGDVIDIAAELQSNGVKATEPELYKNLKSTLLVKDLDTQQTEEIALTQADQKFTGSYKVADEHDYELIVRLEDSSMLRESEPVTISAKQGGAVQPTATPSATQAPDAAKDEKPFPWLYVILGVVGLLIVILAALYILSMVKKANKGFFGQMVIEVRDENTGERSNPQYKKLNSFKGKFNLHQLLQLAPELAEVSKISFSPGKNDTIILTNSTSCVVEIGGRVIDASKGKELRKNDRVKITLQNVNKSISIEYII
ncbi:VWA domain-containing protein [Paenibacillus albiflavus]|uniref:VWA domain-containing protein n=2 Tax=Paenibacillus albiflavus TaxID=2545760 RepID=A0A4R4EAI8_9BACL|nr:VWA domain-containing protein [Paenibacillus albiflavus]